jgi:hypothetical protein
VPLVAEVAKDNPQAIFFRLLRVDLWPQLGDAAPRRDQAILF